MTDRVLGYGQQHIGDDDVAAVVAALRGEFLTTGPAVQAFETAFARAVGARHAVACMNGTAALHLAALALDLKPGDCAIVPAVTFLATANAVRYVGAEPVFADVDANTALMSPEHLEAAIVRAPSPPKAVFPVHIGGPSCDMAGIAAVAARHGMTVVEDACHALGTTGDGAGMPFIAGDCRWSRMTVFSAHPVKMMTMGEGGVVTTNEAHTAKRLARLRNHGLVRDATDFTVREQAFAADESANPWYYEMDEVGFNYRASDLQCALGSSQLAKLDRFVERRRVLIRLYEEALRDAPVRGIEAETRNFGQRVGWHLFRIRVDFRALGCDRAAFMRRLLRRGVGSQVHYMPLYRHPYYARRWNRQGLPGAEAYYAGTLSLPLHCNMTDGDVGRVVAAIAEAAEPGPHA
ncbi:MAG: UDP-4-amino-4,6-dideoxy-N-acetyl-beta-L-altrosamine transaminase [Alphaproteobacteria bacterium]|nr:UDP-4-amino-4,6-dideoxy-N-acetyl-beta-L-altrosamine transaminase [Alphaproteobacteria bacterium]